MDQWVPRQTIQCFLHKNVPENLLHTLSRIFRHVQNLILYKLINDRIFMHFRTFAYLNNIGWYYKFTCGSCAMDAASSSSVGI